jgi:hypothetical protein
MRADIACFMIGQPSAIIIVDNEESHSIQTYNCMKATPTSTTVWQKQSHSNL